MINQQEPQLEFVINADNQQNDDMKCVQLYIDDNKGIKLILLLVFDKILTCIELKFNLHYCGR